MVSYFFKFFLLLLLSGCFSDQEQDIGNVSKKIALVTALNYRRQKNFFEAIKIYKNIERIFPNDPDAELGLILIEIEQGNWVSAINLLNNSSHRNNLEFIKAKIIALLYLRSPSSIAQAGQIIFNLLNNSTVSAYEKSYFWHYYGVFFVLKNDFVNAELSLKNAINLGLKGANLFSNFGLVLLVNNKIKDGSFWINKACLEDQQNYLCQRNRLIVQDFLARKISSRDIKNFINLVV